MDLFEEISKSKKEFPKTQAITGGLGNWSLNFYQIFSIGLFIIVFVIGIFLGNLFATCQASSYFYSEECIVREFNFSLMIFIWFIGALLSLFIFAIGHIIGLLNEINQKLGKFKS